MNNGYIYPLLPYVRNIDYYYGEPHNINASLYHVCVRVCMQAKKTDASDSEDEAETKRQNSAAKLNLQATVFQAIGLAWPNSTHTQG